jgi:hypothetical protein
MLARRCLGLALGLFVCTGCGTRVYPVKGLVSFEGKPMKGGGTIVFQPTGSGGKAASGEIAADGTYTLTTFQPGDGAMPGDFRVVVIQTVTNEPEPSPDGKAPPKPVVLVAEKDRIPANYGGVSSPLTAKVEAKDMNEINLDLKRSDGTNYGPPPGGAMLRDPTRHLYAALKR